jgi:hypothetical protein
LRRAAGLFLACIVGALGCWGADNHPAAGSAAEDLFPLVAGTKWVYEVRMANLGKLQIEHHARGTMELPKGTGEVFVVDETNLGPNLGFVETQPVGYFVTDEGYLARLTGLDYDDDGKLMYVGVEDPAWILPINPEQGHAWGQLTKMFQTPEGGGADLGWSGQVEDPEPVSVPAGDFDDATVIMLTYRDSHEPGVEPLLIYHDYYVRGIGLVRSVADDPDGDESKRVETVLKSFQFPD